MAARTNYISLFTGAGGLDIGFQLALPESRCVCYVEREFDAARILGARIADGCLDDAPVWTDVRSFDGKPWRGIVDFIIGGFPCQDISVAGKRKGLQGSRSGLWWQFHRIIGDVQPSGVFLENVSNITSGTPSVAEVVTRSLAGLGYDTEWMCLRASAVGAAHRRNRWFCLAFPGCGSSQRWRDARIVPQETGGTEKKTRERKWSWNATCNSGKAVEHAKCTKWWPDTEPGRDPREGPDGKRQAAGRPGESSEVMGNTCNSGLEGWPCQRRDVQCERPPAERTSLPVFAPGPGADGPDGNEYRRQVWGPIFRDYPHLTPTLESSLHVLVDGVAVVVDAERTAQLRAAGNGVVPLQAAVALTELMRRSGC